MACPTIRVGVAAGVGGMVGLRRAVARWRLGNCGGSCVGGPVSCGVDVVFVDRQSRYHSDPQVAIARPTLKTKFWILDK